MTDTPNENQQPEPVLNGIRVFSTGEVVGIAIGDGQQALNARLNPVAARKIGMAILNEAVKVGRILVAPTPAVVGGPVEGTDG